MGRQEKRKGKHFGKRKGFRAENPKGRGDGQFFVMSLGKRLQKKVESSPERENGPKRDMIP